MYEKFNHHHEITKEQRLVDFGSGEFIADKEMIPLLKALNEIGLKTRTHCCGHKTGQAFVAILLDNVSDISVREVYENSSTRDFGTVKELLLMWEK